MYKLLALLIMFSILAACSNPANRDPSSPYYDIPITTKISLLKTVTIPAHTAHIYFQGAVITSPKDTNQYHPHCRFDVRMKSETAQTINPNTYTLRRVSSNYDVVSLPDLRYYYTEFMLYSAKDTNVLSLKCGQWSSYDDMSTYLTIKQIQETLGDYMKIKLPASSINIK